METWDNAYKTFDTEPGAYETFNISCYLKKSHSIKEYYL